MNSALAMTTLAVAVLCGASQASADTWTGKISDSSCGGSHDTDDRARQEGQ